MSNNPLLVRFYSERIRSAPCHADLDLVERELEIEDELDPVFKNALTALSEICHMVLHHATLRMNQPDGTVPGPEASAPTVKGVEP